MTPRFFPEACTKTDRPMYMPMCQPEGEAAERPEGETVAPEAETAEPAAPAFPPLAIDYSVWGVVQGDAQREFDPAQGAWL